MTLTSCISSYAAHVAHIISCPPTLLPTQFTKDKKLQDLSAPLILKVNGVSSLTF